LGFKGRGFVLVEKCDMEANERAFVSLGFEERDGFVEKRDCGAKKEEEEEDAVGNTAPKRLMATRGAHMRAAARGAKQPIISGEKPLS
jgi:hypothetical protein